jgi:hypothetical protein
MNVFLSRRKGNAWAGAATSIGGSRLPNIVEMYGIYGNYATTKSWWNHQRVASLLNHELGHLFGLRHTWGIDPREECEDTPEHDNCFGLIENEPDPTDEKYAEDPSRYERDYEKYLECNEIEEVSNNVMDYNSNQSAYTPCQLEIVHKNLGTSNNAYTFCDTPPENGYWPLVAAFSITKPSACESGPFYINGEWRAEEHKQEEAYNFEIRRANYSTGEDLGIPAVFNYANSKGQGWINGKLGLLNLDTITTLAPGSYSITLFMKRQDEVDSTRQTFVIFNDSQLEQDVTLTGEVDQDVFMARNTLTIRQAQNTSEKYYLFLSGDAIEVEESEFSLISHLGTTEIGCHPDRRSSQKSKSDPHFSDAFCWYPGSNQIVFSREAPIKKETTKTFRASIYPNPTQETVTIYWEKESEYLYLTIHTAAGKPLQEVRIRNGDSFSLKTLPPGLYYLSVMSNSGRRDTWKIVKE